MIQRLLILVLLCGISGPLWAQQESLASQTHKQRLRAHYLSNDTAQAIITLYGRRQAGGASWIVSSALAAARLATASGTQTTTGGGYVVQDNRSNAGVAFLAAVPFAAYGAGKLLHYSNGNLEKVLTDYGAGKPLPRSLRRKLKGRFFAQPIIMYKPAH